MVSKNPLDNLDFSTPEFKAGVEKLADFLKINKVIDCFLLCSSRLNCRHFFALCVQIFWLGSIFMTNLLPHYLPFCILLPVTCCLVLYHNVFIYLYFLVEHFLPNLLNCLLHRSSDNSTQSRVSDPHLFCGSGSGQKSSCGSGSGSWGYPGEGSGGKGKKWFFFFEFFSRFRWFLTTDA